MGIKWSVRFHFGTLRNEIIKQNMVIHYHKDHKERNVLLTLQITIFD